jgi:amino acid adenylation domain-containing protein
VADPHRRLSELPLLSETEEHQLLVEWNETARDYPADVCLHELFERQVKHSPDAVALVYEEEQLSYRELNNRANQLARYLRNLGIGPDDRVSFLLERSPTMVIAFLGILKAGAAYVPLDTTYPRERLSFMVEDSGSKLLITERRLRDLLPAQLSVPVLCMSEAAQLLDCYSTANPQTGVTPESLAYVIYTSGSTGTPKGVMIEHHGVVNYLFNYLRDFDISQGEGVPVQSPISFDLTVSSLHFGLVAGQKVRLLPEAEGADALARALRSHGPASLVKLTPAHLDMLSQTVRAEEAAGCALAFIVGGEALTWEQLAFWRKHAPQTRIINEYGPTETVVGCCSYEVKNDDAGSGEASVGGVPIGKPLANAQLYVLDEHLRLVPPGVRGELYVGGDGVGRGYVNRPEQTAQRFIPDPFSGKAGARLYHTGDICRQRADGTLEYVGRIDSQVKVRGYRIELSEIEAALMQHEAVGEVVVIAEDEGGGHKRLIAYLTAEKDARAEALEVGELRRYLRERLPEYMIPAAFMVLDAMPLTTNGKVDRRALPASDGLRTEPGAVYVAPRNQTEEVLVEIWQEVLRVDRVGVEDNFFDLGGHSLLATRLLSKVREVFGVEVALREVFAEPTVAALATAIEELLIAELEVLSEMEAQSQS